MAEVERENTADMETDTGRMKNILEAVVFAAGYPVPYSKLADTLHTDAAVVREMARKLAFEYRERGVQFLLFEDACQMATREEYQEEIKQTLGIRRGGNLSRASLEVLAIAAYQQPVTRAYIDEVRGVDSNYVVTSLVEKGLLEVKGKLDAPGRPSLYGTTADFLRCFGLASLKELPAVDVFLSPEEENETETQAPL